MRNLQLSLRQRMETLPVLRPILERLYEKRFAGDCYAAFRGVFASFAEARASAPQTKPVGFDSIACTHEHSDRRRGVSSCDYPVLFWLSRILAPNSRLFDLGGHVGGQFYGFSHYLHYPPDFVWTVLDLPKVIEFGRDLAVQEHADALRFTTSIDDANDADIFMAAGSVQYVESPSLSETLRRIETKPRHLLLNKLPLYDGPSYVTLQNSGFGFNPLHVFNRECFIASLVSLGYELVDSWNDESRTGYIPFHPDRCFRSHSGLYFRKLLS